ncbi:tetratricopeptide repeat protein [Flavobacterium sp. CS20]|uniref:type IX secretion system periplasmic lipoprotein PorW/SprE n=1 Tax=Flavobacterium sp. CS20 TaxID=2775246 RepID=UPI001FFD613B|nr:tetratricopeptide repeat protein [Flavobacterium sp. CS20]
MKFNINNFLSLVILALLVSACSTQKNKFVNRNWHAMNTYYNTIYHGNLAVEDGIQTVETEYPENYWDILPVERMQEKPPTPDIFETKTQQNEAKNPDFKRAEEKATKAIQKHSMYIAGEEYNYQIDEAFILLGKARYYSHRYIQAKDAFRYVLNHYPESSGIVDAKIWTEKVNMRLNYYELALQNLLKIQSEYSDLTEEEQTHLNSILAEAHILNNNYNQAIEPLNKAIYYTKDNHKKGRFLYIKAQLFDQLNQMDSANYTYQKVIDLNRKSPRDYMIHAKLERLKNINQDTVDYAYMKSQYNELMENRENRPFLDFIYFDYAEYHNDLDSIDLAIDYYNKSLARNPKDKYLYSRDYLRLAQIYFDQNNYKTAGAYYDSTLTHIDKSKREYRIIAKKRKSLDDVIKYESIANEKDSIIKLVEMNKEEQLAYFNNYVENLKEEAQSVFAQQSASQKALNSSSPTFKRNSVKNQSKLGLDRNNTSNNRENSSGNASFYFYDTNQAQKGLLEFKQTWGNIELNDNWKYGGKRNTKNNEEENKEDVDPFENDPKYQPETYISQIPTDQNIIDSLWIDRNFAYYQLGVIYKEKFKEYQLAKDKFENLLDSHPEERLILPSIYNLYLIAEAQQNTDAKNKWKNKIINEYPESEYATLLLNPKKFKDSENNPQNIYKNLYKAYENQQYDYVIQQADIYTKQLVGRPIAPKFELLKAYAIAKIDGIEAYKEALNYVALTYPQSDEGKFAQKRYRELKSKVTQNKFKPDTDQETYKLVYYFNDNQVLEDFLKQLKTSFEDLEYDFRINKEIYTSSQNFVVISGLNSLLGAQGLAEILIKEGKISKDFNYFAISDENYSIVQIYKNLDQYLNHLNK